MKGSSKKPVDTKLHALSQRLESLRQISDRLKTFDVNDPASADLSGKEFSKEEADEEAKGLSSLLKGVIPKKTPKRSLKERAQEKQDKLKEVTKIKTRSSVNKKPKK